MSMILIDGLERNKLKGRHCDIVRWTANIGDPALSWINSIIISTFSGSKVSQHLWSYMVIPSLLRILILATAIVYAWWYDHPPIWMYIPTLDHGMGFLLKWGIPPCVVGEIYGKTIINSGVSMEFPHHFQVEDGVAIIRNPANRNYCMTPCCRCLQGNPICGGLILTIFGEAVFFDFSFGSIDSSFCRGLPKLWRGSGKTTFGWPGFSMSSNIKIHHLGQWCYIPSGYLT